MFGALPDSTWRWVFEAASCGRYGDWVVNDTGFSRGAAATGRSAPGSCGTH